MTFRNHVSGAVAAILASCLAAPVIGGTGDPTWTRYTPGNTGIPGDYVHTVYVDEQDRPWIPAYIPFWEHGGMARLDGDVWTTISNVDYPVIVSPRFNDIVRDADGVMWIASDHGLLRYDPAVGPDSLVRWDHDNSPLPISQLRNLDFDPDGNLWIAIHDVNDVPPGGLARFDPATETWDVWTTANGLPWGRDWPGWDWVDFVAVVPDLDGGFTVWFGSSEMGMATYKDGEFFWYGNTWPPADPMTPMGFMSNDPVDEQGNAWMLLWAGLARRAPDGTFTVVGFPAGLDTEVSRAYAASNGRCFLGTYHGDTFLWDGGWSYLGNWGGGHTYAFAEDSTGAFWTGGIGGSAKLEDGFWQRYRLTNSGMLGYFMRDIEFDPAGNVYMNGNAAPGVGGFTIFDGTRWTCVNDFNYGIGPPWGLPSDEVDGLKFRANGYLAVAPAGLQGVLDWNPEDFQFNYLVNQGYDLAILEEDGLGRLWAADDSGSFVFRITGGNAELFTVINSPLPGGNIRSIIDDPDQPGFVWIANAFAMIHTDGDTWDLYPRELLGLDQNTLGYHITAADLAADGTLWVGAGIGLYHFDAVTSEYVQYTPANSALPSTHINHIEIAPDGSIWVASFPQDPPYTGGLTRFDEQGSTTWTTGNSPLPHNQLADIAVRDVPGGQEVWVGTSSEGVAVLTFQDGAGVPGDANGDGEVGIEDFLIVLANWGPCPEPCPPACLGDVDADCEVGIGDFLMVLGNWS